MPPDLVKRFSHTPFSATLILNNMPVRVETNDPLVLRRLQLESHSFESIHETPVSHWRIVVEEQVNLPMTNSCFYGLAHEGLVFLRVGHNGSSARGAFLAADRRTRFGISFVATEFIEDEHLFTQHYSPAFLLMIREIGDRYETVP